MILLIDNYDSFTWNLVQRMWELEPTLEINVVRNDKITADEAAALNPSHLIISPGPCTPDDAGNSPAIIEALKGKVPILGVCLGHQCIGQLHNMPVVRHQRIVHGKTSKISHDGKGLFAGLDANEPITVTRYHSLVVTEDNGVPDGWEISAWYEDELEDGPNSEQRTIKVIMGLRRQGAEGEAPVEGLQFHPESFLSLAGPVMLANFLGLPRPEVMATPA